MHGYIGLAYNRASHRGHHKLRIGGGGGGVKGLFNLYVVRCQLLLGKFATCQAAAAGSTELPFDTLVFYGAGVLGLYGRALGIGPWPDYELVYGPSSRATCRQSEERLAQEETCQLVPDDAAWILRPFTADPPERGVTIRYHITLCDSRSARRLYIHLD